MFDVPLSPSLDLFITLHGVLSAIVNFYTLLVMLFVYTATPRYRLYLIGAQARIITISKCLGDRPCRRRSPLVTCPTILYSISNTSHLSHHGRLAPCSSRTRSRGSGKFLLFSTT